MAKTGKKYSYNMKGEHPPRPVLEEGWRKFKVIDCEEMTSKAGNEMFLVSVEDVETGGVLDVYCVATEKKRWLLKSLLGACGVAAAKDGIYEWDIPDILEKEVMGKVQNSDETWVNREGDEVVTPKSRITEFKIVQPSSSKKEKEAVPF